MEDTAVSLTMMAGYANAETVEYLYFKPAEKFYFLELIETGWLDRIIREGGIRIAPNTQHGGVPEKERREQ